MRRDTCNLITYQRIKNTSYLRRNTNSTICCFISSKFFYTMAVEYKIQKTLKQGKKTISKSRQNRRLLFHSILRIVVITLTTKPQQNQTSVIIHTFHSVIIEKREFLNGTSASYLIISICDELNI